MVNPPFVGEPPVELTPTPFSMELLDMLARVEAQEVREDRLLGVHGDHGGNLDGWI